MLGTEEEGFAARDSAIIKNKKIEWAKRKSGDGEEEKSEEKKGRPANKR